MSDVPKKGKRGHNEGSLHQRASDGLWVADVSLGYGPDGKRIRKRLYGKPGPRPTGSSSRPSGRGRMASRFRHGSTRSASTSSTGWSTQSRPVSGREPWRATSPSVGRT